MNPTIERKSDGGSCGCSAWLGRINVTRDTDCNLYLLPTVGLNWQKLLDFERDGLRPPEPAP